MKVEVAVLGYPSLTSLMVSEDVKQHVPFSYPSYESSHCHEYMYSVTPFLPPVGGRHEGGGLTLAHSLKPGPPQNPGSQ